MQQSTEQKVANTHATDAVMSCLDANAAGQACRGQGCGKCLARGRRRHKATKASRSVVCSPHVVVLNGKGGPFATSGRFPILGKRGHSDWPLCVLTPLTCDNLLNALSLVIAA